MIRPRCAHCDTPLRESARTCERCGAPATHAYGGHAAPAGFTTHEDPWRGFRVNHPEGWLALHPAAGSVAFVHPDGAGRLTLRSLPALPGAGPEQVVRMTLSAWPGGEARVLHASADEMSVVFRAPGVTGQVHARRSGEGALVAIGEAFAEGFDVAEPTAVLLSSLAGVPVLERVRFVCPYEQSFTVSHPRGWTVQSTIAQHGNIRTPMCRLSGDPSGAVLVACELENHLFTDAPLPAPEPSGGGFFATLGRMARQLDASMAFGPPPLPADLGILVERYFVPRWIAAIPGSTFLRLDRHSPVAGDARMQLPGGLVRVVQVAVLRFPGSPSWAGALLSWYQAPADVLAKLEPTLRGVLESFTVDPRWRANDQGRFQHALRAQEAHAAQMLHIQRQNSASWLQQARIRSDLIAETGAAVSDLQMQGWHASQASSDAVQHGTLNAIQERTDFAGPDQTVYNVSSSFERVWSNGSGQLFGGDWSVDAPADWTELKRLD